MKPFSFRLILSLAAALLAASCAHLDVASSGNPDRVLKGAVAAGASLPAGAEVVVRLVAIGNASAPRGDAGLLTRSGDSPQATEQLLGEHRQILASATAAPVPFQIEYRADDSLLRRGVNIDARVSIGGKLRFRTINGHVVTLASAPFRQELTLQPVQ